MCENVEIIYQDKDIIVCIKPARVLSTDEPGGLPDLIRQELGDPAADVRTVHRLDRVVSGLMVLARNPASASELSRQIRVNQFQKEYLAVVHGCPAPDKGTLTDLFMRDKARKMTMIVNEPGKDVQEAILHYQVLSTNSQLTRVQIQLVTGRTHQIRVQFSGRGMPLVGERKYDSGTDDCDLALWSCRIAFAHPKTGEQMEFYRLPPDAYPWSIV